MYHLVAPPTELQVALDKSHLSGHLKGILSTKSLTKTQINLTPSKRYWQ
jgi:hypothetical protein